MIYTIEPIIVNDNMFTKICILKYVTKIMFTKRDGSIRLRGHSLREKRFFLRRRGRCDTLKGKGSLLEQVIPEGVTAIPYDGFSY